MVRDQETEKENSNELIQLHRYSIWQLIKTYWQKPDAFRIYVSSFVIIAFTLALVGFNVIFNYWNNYFYNALQAYNVHATVRLLVIFFGLAAVYIVTAVYRYYLAQMFGLKWRRWLTEQLVARWLQKRGYYYLEQFDKKTDNPDQRIQEDVAGLVTNAIDLAMGLVEAIVTIVAFLYILWHLSGILTIPMGHLGTLHIPGYLVWVSLIYSFAGTLITFKVGRPLIHLNFEQQHREASFRFAALDLRLHAENVALYRGESHQKNILQRVFNGVLDNWYQIIMRQRRLLWYTAGYGQIAVVLPLMVALPNYFGKVFLLGGLMQSLGAFSRVQDALSFLINSYTQIAQWHATGNRLTSFINHLDEIEEQVAQADHLAFNKDKVSYITTKNLNISTPQGERLLTNINKSFEQGKHYLIQGPSGIGKSTFLRTLAGIWPYAEGHITLPDQQPIMFLPQKPYMPIGTLAEAMMFPDKVSNATQDQLAQILKTCRLEKFTSRLNEVARWSEQLSPGEQQRIAFARVLMHKPKWLFLDESTSMLDLDNENYFYQLLKERLPQASIISVGHRASLAEFHDEVLQVKAYAAQA